jgi:hypothetical protein
MTKKEIAVILEDHKKWLDDDGGKRADLRGANLREADLREANLRWANLSEADLSEADLREANLRWADLSGADLSEANLRWADMSGANLSEAYLSGADLREANLRWANLSEADLSGADLRGADLREANLCGANLSRANLCCSLGSIFSDCCWPGHGEFGRRLLAVRIAGDDVYFCGCFLGSLDNLREYIAKGDEQYRQSRTVAADFVAARMAEMGGTE